MPRRNRTAPPAGMSEAAATSLMAELRRTWARRQERLERRHAPTTEHEEQAA